MSERECRGCAELRERLERLEARLDRAPPSAAGEIAGKLAGLARESVLELGELAERLGKSKRTVQRMVGRGELPKPAKFGRERTWTVGSIVDWVRLAVEREQQEEAALLLKLQRHEAVRG